MQRMLHKGGRCINLSWKHRWQVAGGRVVRKGSQMGRYRCYWKAGVGMVRRDG